MDICILNPFNKNYHACVDFKQLTHAQKRDVILKTILGSFLFGFGGVYFFRSLVGRFKKINEPKNAPLKAESIRKNSLPSTNQTTEPAHTSLPPTQFVETSSTSQTESHGLENNGNSEPPPDQIIVNNDIQKEKVEAQNSEQKPPAESNVGTDPNLLKRIIIGWEFAQEKEIDAAFFESCSKDFEHSKTFIELSDVDKYKFKKRQFEPFLRYLVMTDRIVGYARAGNLRFKICKVPGERKTIDGKSFMTRETLIEIDNKMQNYVYPKPEDIAGDVSIEKTVHILNCIKSERYKSFAEVYDKSYNTIPIEKLPFEIKTDNLLDRLVFHGVLVAWNKNNDQYVVKFEPTGEDIFYKTNKYTLEWRDKSKIDADRKST